jgi:hypothetical protein
MNIITNFTIIRNQKYLHFDKNEANFLDLPNNFTVRIPLK